VHFVNLTLAMDLMLRCEINVLVPHLFQHGDYSTDRAEKLHQ
jgi:hypothetical protein